MVKFLQEGSLANPLPKGQIITALSFEKAPQQKNPLIRTSPPFPALNLNNRHTQLIETPLNLNQSYPSTRS